MNNLKIHPRGGVWSSEIIRQLADGGFFAIILDTANNSRRTMAKKGSKNIKYVLITVVIIFVLFVIIPTVWFALTPDDYKAKCTGKDECVWHDSMDGNIYQNNKYKFQYIFGSSLEKIDAKNAEKDSLFPLATANEVERVAFDGNDIGSKRLVKVFKSNDTNLNDSIIEYKKELSGLSGASNIIQTNSSQPVWEKKALIEFTVGAKTYADIVQKNNDYVVGLEVILKDGNSTVATKDDIDNIASLISVTN